jgi:nucleotide-binding universal stress UspA family protein
MNTVPRHILVPTDFGEIAEHALAHAIDLAARLGARVTLVHVYGVPYYGYAEGFLMTAELLEAIEGAARAAIADLAKRAQRPDVKIDTVLRQGMPWLEIDAVAKESGVDLIVMGTRGRKGLARALLGSVAEKVVRTAPCPVLTLHGPESKDA